MDTAQWPQEILVKPIEEMIPNNTHSNTISNISNNINSNINNANNSISKPPSTSLERKVRPQKDHAVNCPRCNSTNTKFCYYNNYSLTQPRYFCKTCRRYWTEGGSLRNIPVGGGSRKNKRSSSSSTSSSSTNSASKKLSSHDLVHHQHHHHNPQNPKIGYHQGHDLNLGFAPAHHHQQQPAEFRSLSEFMQLPSIDTTPKSHMPNSGGADNNANNTSTNNNNHHHQLSALELLNGLTSSRGLTPFMPMPVPVPVPVPDPNNGVYSSGFPSLMHDFKPSLNFSLVDGLGNGYGSLQQQVHQQTTDEQQQDNNNGRLLFPFEDLKQVSSTTSGDHNANNTNNNNTNSSADNNNHDQNGDNQGDDSTTPGYWSGMLGNGGSW